MLPRQHEVRLPGALDRLGNLGVGRMDEVPDLAADCLLPGGKGIDICVDTRVSGVGHRATIAFPIQEAREVNSVTAV